MNFKAIILTFLTCLSFCQISAEKHGMIIAVGAYPSEGRWPSISSQNDVHHIQNALMAIGFKKDNISGIYDADATRDGIIQALEQLESRLSYGDIVYIHFSGHGQQVWDDNSDELDNLDEAIVPYDSPMIFQKGVYEGERLIRDDLLGEITNRMRKVIGPNGQLILILDSCHSGTGTRGMGLVRGTDKVMAADNFKIKMNTGEKSSNLSRGESKDMAPMASFFGASPRELNYETLDDQSKPVGSLSYATSTVLSGMRGAYSFEDFFERVKLKMKVFAPRQNPQWEGPKNILLFGGEVPERKNVFKVEDIINANEIKVAMGSISDVYAGSEIEVRSVDQKKVLARGYVSQANLASSIIILEAPLQDLEDLMEVKVTKNAFPQFKANIKIDLASDSKWLDAAESLKTIPVFEKVESNADIFITECGDDRSIQLATKDGTVLFVEKMSRGNTENQVNKMKNVIRSFVQGKFLRSYDNPSSNFDFSLEIEQLNCVTNETIKRHENNEDIVINIGTCVRFKVTNTGIVGAYFTIIDIQPDNIINLVTPAIDLGYTADEYYLKPGATYVTNYPIEIAQPSGEETLKLITSKEPLDLSGIIATQGKSTRGIKNLNPFEEFFAGTYNVNTRGAKVKKKQGEEVGTNTVYFKIID
jgi:hypothetical protein